MPGKCEICDGDHRERQCAKGDAPMFPMQDGPWIPWWLAERVYEVYELLYPGSARQQSLKQLGERGGFGWKEVAFMWDEAARNQDDRVRQTRKEMFLRFRESQDG